MHHQGVRLFEGFLTHSTHEWKLSIYARVDAISRYLTVGQISYIQQM